MTTESAHRSVTVERAGPGRMTAVNSRGGRIFLGADGEYFTPVELLLVAIAGCTALDVDALTSRRAEPETFEVVIDAEKVRDEQGNHLTDIEVTYRIKFPAGEAGDKARAVLPEAVRRSRERLCTVGRTVELATPVAGRVE